MQAGFGCHTAGAGSPGKLHPEARAQDCPRFRPDRGSEETPSRRLSPPAHSAGRVWRETPPRPSPTPRPAQAQGAAAARGTSLWGHKCRATAAPGPIRLADQAPCLCTCCLALPPARARGNHTEGRSNTNTTQTLPEKRGRNTSQLTLRGPERHKRQEDFNEPP